MGRVLEIRRVALVALALVVGAIPAIPAEAWAQARPGATLDPARRAEAKRLFDGGADLYAQGDYEGAITAWMKSYEISGLPLIFESVANAHERLGRPRQAREALLRWRDAAPQDEHELLDRRLRNLDERIARLEADERAAADARARDEEARRQQGGGGSTEVGPPPPGESSPLVPIGIVVGGVGLGAIGAGLVLGAVAAGERPDEAAACRTTSAGSLCLAAERDAIESSSSLALGADILWIAGAAAAAAGVVLVVVGSSADEPGLRATLTPVAGPTGTGATLQGAF